MRPKFYEKLTQTKALKPAFDRAWQFKMWVRHLWQAQFPEAPIREFMRHNRRKYVRNGTSSDAVVLIGQYGWNPSMYNYSIVANHLAARTHGRIETFAFHERRDRVTERVFASFGAQQVLNNKKVERYAGKARELTDKVVAGLKTKWDVLHIQFEGVTVGDLIYDTYLRYLIKATVRLDDPELKKMIFQAAQIFYAARDYFATRHVVGVLPDHTVYFKCGIVTRLALLQNIPVYLLPYHPNFYLLKIDPDLSAGMRNPTKRFPYYRYRELFERLSPKEQEEGRAKAREHLATRLAGKMDEVLVGRSAYGAPTTERILAPTGKPKILILLHDFCDSVHSFRQMLFPDFYEWAKYTFAAAEKTGFEWYAKPHPNSLTSEGKNLLNRETIAALSAECPSVRILDAGVSNRQLVDEGIAAAFTVHGTAGHEFAAMGVPVVNAGDNLHVAFDFNLNPASVEEYARCIAEAGRLGHKIDQAQVEAFYYMHYFYFRENNRSEVNPIDAEWRNDPDFFAKSRQPAALNYFLQTETPEKMARLSEYLDRCFEKSAEAATVKGL
jgi:hypothetical protein